MARNESGSNERSRSEADQARCSRRRLLQGAAAAAAFHMIPSEVLAAGPELPSAYRKLWEDPKLAERVERNIEQHRKGPATVTLVDRAGEPLPGVSLEVQQTGHEFLFGCNLFVLGQLETEKANREYEEKFLRLFNFATIPFYWASTEPERGRFRYEEGSEEIWRRPPPDRLVQWCRKHEVTMKGHPLLWHNSRYNPDWRPDDPEALKKLYVERFRRIGERYSADIPIWDVVNESLVSGPDWPLYEKERAYVAWAFGQAERFFEPGNMLRINEVTGVANRTPASHNPYLKQVEALIEQNTAVEGVGFQFHMFSAGSLRRHVAGNTFKPLPLLDLYHRFGKLNLPLFISEITIPTVGEDGPAVQEKVAENLYRLWFSVPQMAGITWWNLGDGLAVRGENTIQGGLLDSGLDPKPSYRALDRLINDEWQTRLSAETDESGRVEFNGFYGRYSVRADLPGGRRSFDIRHTTPSSSHTLQPGREHR